MPGVVPNAYAKFQKNSINNEYRQNAWAEGGLCPILPISLNLISTPTNLQRDPISGSGSKDVGIPQNLHRPQIPESGDVYRKLKIILLLRISDTDKFYTAKVFG